jgi:hypothetical protein
MAPNEETWGHPFARIFLTTISVLQVASRNNVAVFAAYAEMKYNQTFKDNTEIWN